MVSIDPPPVARAEVPTHTLKVCLVNPKFEPSYWGFEYALPLYPGDNGAEFNESFFHESPNALARISPKDAHQADVVRVIDVREARPGRTLSLVMDGELQDALCYLS